MCARSVYCHEKICAIQEAVQFYFSLSLRLPLINLDYSNEVGLLSQHPARTVVSMGIHLPFLLKGREDE